MFLPLLLPTTSWPPKCVVTPQTGLCGPCSTPHPCFPTAALSRRLHFILHGFLHHSRKAYQPQQKLSTFRRLRSDGRYPTRGSNLQAVCYMLGTWSYLPCQYLNPEMSFKIWSEIATLFRIFWEKPLGCRSPVFKLKAMTLMCIDHETYFRPWGMLRGVQAAAVGQLYVDRVQEKDKGVNGLFSLFRALQLCSHSLRDSHLFGEHRI